MTKEEKKVCDKCQGEGWYLDLDEDEQVVTLSCDKCGEKGYVVINVSKEFISNPEN